MEKYFYKCLVCGFVHIVPAYWVSFDPEPTMEFIHINPDTKKECENHILKLKEE